MDLSELSARCIHCGLCLESCPTYVLTHDETKSPRGRIHLARSALEGRFDYGEEMAAAIDTCLGCRACETACPSGVRYGSILELVRERMESRRPRRALKAFTGALTHRPLLHLQLAGSRFLPSGRVPGLLSRALAGGAAEADLPRPQTAGSWPPLRQEELPPIRGEVFLLDGCVMEPLFARVHEATTRLLQRCGFRVRRTGALCCGALHAHSGYLTDARKRALRLAQALEGGTPLVTNSAGCGSTIKDYRELDPALGELAARARDLTEFLVEHGFEERLRESRGLRVRATYHDACHLAHGQGIRSQPRRLLEAVTGLELVTLNESDMCCGSAGTYNLTQPAMARRLLERKWRNIEATGAEAVVLANPGCHAWIEQGSREKAGRAKVYHIAEMLEASFAGRLP
ncbi:MAG: (Fe-S)-binding protein [Fimbriimonadales bacterium]|nr:(Fe-S)-binding protein [Fimbriimonadales bacterium]